MNCRATIMPVLIFCFVSGSILFAQYDQGQVTSGTFNFEIYNNPVITPDGRWLLAANPSRNEVIKVDILDGSFTALQAGDRPAMVSLSPGGQMAAAVNVGQTNFAGDTVSIFNTFDGSTAPVATFDPSGNFGHFNNVVFTNDNRYAFVASRYNGFLYAFDPVSGDLVTGQYLGSAPSRCVLSPDGRWMAVLYDEGSVFKIKILDLVEFYANQTFSFPRTLNVQSTRQDATNAVFTPDGGALLVSAYNLNKVVVFDVESAGVEAQVNVGSGPVMLHLDPRLNRAYSVNILNNSVSIIDLSDWTSTEHTFSSVGFDQSNNVITVPGSEAGFVCGYSNSRLIHFDAISGSQTQVYFTGNNPAGLAMDANGAVLAAVSQTNNRFDLFTSNRQVSIDRVDVDDDTNLGFAFLNVNTPGSASLRIDAFPDEGGTAAAQVNVNLPAQAQFVREWTSAGLGLPAPFSGRAMNTTPLLDIKGFAMFYDNSGQWLDGFPLNPTPYTELVVPYIELYENRVSRLHLANPNSLNLWVTIRLYRNGAFPIDKQVLVPNRGRLVVDDLRGLFQITEDETGFLNVSCSEPVSALLEFGDDTSRAAIPARGIFETTGRQVVLPHVVEGGGWQTLVALSNTTAGSVRLALDYYSENGLKRFSSQVDIPANSQRADRAWKLLNLVEPFEPLSGWLSITGPTQGVHVITVFTTDDGGQLAALDAQTLPRKLHYVSHIAQDGFYFTGVAMVNASGGSTNILVRFFNEEGTLIKDQAVSSLGSNWKYVRLLSSDPFLLNQQIGGYIQIVSNRPIFSYALFGIDGQYLSAIPAQ